MRKLVIVAAAVVLAAGQARADWQYTKWGMTPEEVAAAGGTAVIGLSASDRHERRLKDDDALQRARHQAGEFSFDVTFGYRANALSLVSASLTDKRPISAWARAYTRA